MQTPGLNFNVRQQWAVMDAHLIQGCPITRGVVISTGSISGMRGTTFAGHAVHGAAKAGVINLTEHLAVSGGPHHIRAVSISPG